MSPPRESITSHLLSHSPQSLTSATQHAFLLSSGRGTLPPSTLRAWLVQDRLYALSYISFISTLLARLRIPTSANRTETLEWRLADALIGCLTNIRRELGMFEDVARAQGWSRDLDDARPNRVTRTYIDLFAGAAGASAGPAGVWKGMVTLWATEKCYLDAWTYASAQIKGEVAEDDVLRKTLIPNWSSQEFVDFVKVLAELVDEMGGLASEVDVKVAEDAWEQVLWVEQRFWPEESSCGLSPGA